MKRPGPVASIVPMDDTFLTPASTACFTAAASPWPRNPKIAAKLEGTFDGNGEVDGDDDSVDGSEGRRGGRGGSEKCWVWMRSIKLDKIGCCGRAL